MTSGVGYATSATPGSGYTINPNFNTLVFTYNGSSYKMKLATGNYDISTLQAEFNDQMNNLLGLNKLVMSYNSKKDSFKFTSDSVFTFKFNQQEKTLAYLLGFRENQDYTAVSVGGQFELEAEFKCNFDYNNYVIMDIEQFDNLKSVDSELNRTFAIIPKDSYNKQNVIDLPQYIKRFSPPIGKLNKLRIRLYDRFGNDYDFQNQDHRFELLITSFKQQRKYGNIFAA